MLTCAHSKTLATLMCNIDHCVLADSIGPCNQECVTVVPANFYSPGHPSQHQQRLISGPRWHRPPSPGSLAAESSAPPSPSSPPAEPGDPPTCPAAPAAFLQAKKKEKKNLIRCTSLKNKTQSVLHRAAEGACTVPSLLFMTTMELLRCWMAWLYCSVRQ